MQITDTGVRLPRANRGAVVVGRACGTRAGRRMSFATAFLLVAALVSPAAAQNRPTLTGDDYVEILQLYFQYPLVLDSGDAEGYADLFTTDGSFNDRVGRQALIDFVKGRAATTVRHAPLTPVIVATPEGARGTVLNLFVDVGQMPAVVTRITQYRDTLVKTPDGWRFKTRVNGSADLRPESAARP
ncbi:MAG: nuclear transport factor 2 family protein [Acidobacteria bacterium]|nr:nuclear transport factor 2 family protein [Acidobacteriota bacterium]